MLLKRLLHTTQRCFYEKPKNLKNKKHSSQNWIIRQIKDPYVEKARQENYRCRSAFKLVEINDRYNIFYPGQIVIDCGAAPGSWTQVAVKAVNSKAENLDENVGKVISIDLQPMHHIEGATMLSNLDFTKALSQKRLASLLDGKFADVVMSDMAPNATGMKALDHIKIIDLAYSVFRFALEISSYDATFICKIWDGVKAIALQREVERFYKSLKLVRPRSTRDESSEVFIVAQGFKGLRTYSKTA